MIFKELYIFIVVCRFYKLRENGSGTQYYSMEVHSGSDSRYYERLVPLRRWYNHSNGDLYGYWKPLECDYTYVLAYYFNLRTVREIQLYYFVKPRRVAVYKQYRRSIVHSRI